MAQKAAGRTDGDLRSSRLVRLVRHAGGGRRREPHLLYRRRNDAGRSLSEAHRPRPANPSQDRWCRGTRRSNDDERAKAARWSALRTPRRVGLQAAGLVRRSVRSGGSRRRQNARPPYLPATEALGRRVQEDDAVVVCQTREPTRHGLAAPVHALALEQYEGVVVEVVFKVEVETVAEDYLLPFVSSAINRRQPVNWDDHVATGIVRQVNWPLIRSVMDHDFVYFGGSRMIELLAGKVTRCDERGA